MVNVVDGKVASQGAAIGGQKSLKERVAENARLFDQTGHLFGLESLPRKEEDPGAYESIWHILLNICNSGWAIGCQVSASPIAVEGGDAMWTLHLPTGECICTSRGITGHVGMLASFVGALIEHGYEDDPGFAPGDIFENNDPHYGGIHPMDFDTATPIFYKDELIGWIGSVTHVMDVGCILPGSIGFLNPDCFSDGMPVSMEKVGANDRLYPWYEKRVTSRTRMPDWVMADARARLAGSFVIRERILDLIEKYGVDYYKQVTREYIEDSRRYSMRRLKTQTVPGRLRKSNFKDLAMKGKRVILPSQDIDCLFNLPLEINIGADAKMHLNMSGVSGVVPFGENINPTALASILLNAFSHIVGFDMFSSGTAATYDLELPPAGSWCNPYPTDYHVASGVAWAPAVMWLSSVYETITRGYFTRGYLEEVAAGAACTMTAEFAGMSQFGVYVAGLTLEQASNGAPARAIADGENSAWCIYTPQADQGNAEVAELYFPVMFLGRGLEADSGGYGKFRGGLGHTAIWMVKNTPGIEYQCGCAGLRSKLVGNHGMYGAYPKWPERGSYAADTNMKELIDAQKPLLHERGDPSDPDMLKYIKGRVLATDLVTPFVTPDILHEYDLIVHHVSGAQALGDPIERDPGLVTSDLDSGWTREWVANNINAAVTSYDEKAREWRVDAEATQRKRDDVRAARKARGVPFKTWWQQERAKVAAAENMDVAVLEMWRASMRLSPTYGEDLRAFWQLPDDFTF